MKERAIMLSTLELKKSMEQDPYNLRGGRNRRNTPLSAYNCGGFALSVYNWVTPYVVTATLVDNEDCLDYTDNEREDLMRALYEEGWDNTDIENEILIRDKDFLLSEYPFLEEVNLEDCDPKDTVIAYRLFIHWDDEIGEVDDTDFHFKVRINGFWFEKMGAEEISPCALDENKPWHYATADYTSQIVYFCLVKKRQ